MARFSCPGCGKSYSSFGSLYKHAVLHHDSRCLRDGSLIPISVDELLEVKKRVRSWGENSRQRRARQRIMASSDENSVKDYNASGLDINYASALLRNASAPNDASAPKTASALLNDASALRQSASVCDRQFSELPFKSPSSFPLRARNLNAGDSTSPLRPTMDSNAVHSSETEPFEIGGSLFVQNIRGNDRSLLSTPGLDDSTIVDNGVMNLDDFELSPVYLGDWICSNPIVQCDSCTQTDCINTPEAEVISTHTQAPEGSDSLCFSSNKSTQTFRKDVYTDKMSQVEPMIGEYTGPLPLPGGVSSQRLIRTVVENPELSASEIARQLNTDPNWRLGNEQALGFLETSCLLVVDTVRYIVSRLQEIYDDSRLNDPSGQTGLQDCVLYLNRRAS
jgi:hypothetical protein